MTTISVASVELARQRGPNSYGLRQERASLASAKNATAVALIQKVDPKASTMPMPTQRDKDITTIQAASKDLRPGISAARRPDILADPKDARRQVPAEPPAPSVWNGIPATPAAVVHVQAAQAAQMFRVSNDNRSAVDNLSATTFQRRDHGQYRRRWARHRLRLAGVVQEAVVGDERKLWAGVIETGLISGPFESFSSGSRTAGPRRWCLSRSCRSPRSSRCSTGKPGAA